MVRLFEVTGKHNNGCGGYYLTFFNERFKAEYVDNGNGFIAADLPGLDEEIANVIERKGFRVTEHTFPKFNTESPEKTLQETLSEYVRYVITREEAEKSLSNLGASVLADFITDAVDRGWISFFNLGLNSDGEII
jgi:hypothetical protein